MTPPVIDAHHHLWDPAEADYPWMTEAVSPIIRRFGVEDLAPLLPIAGVDGTVVVQARHDLDESRALLATAAITPFIVGVVGWVDLTAHDVAGTIEALRAGPGGDRLVGVRHQVHDEPDAGWLARRDVRRGLAAVEAAGLAYDLLIRPREFPAARDIVDDLPDLRFVVDHLAKPPIRGGATEPWSAGLRSFGARPNVWCKLSGLVTEADWATWTVGDLAPFVEAALRAFGADRLLFGSDWPVCLLAASYQDVIGAAHELTAGLGPTERAALFGGTARSVYRLPDPA
jgi:L-fucono-1,5-lactonase